MTRSQQPKEEMQKKAGTDEFHRRAAAFLEADKAGRQDELKKMIAEFAAVTATTHRHDRGHGSGGLAPDASRALGASRPRADAMLQSPDQAGLARAAGSAETATPAHAIHDLAAIAVPSHPLGRRVRGWLAWAAIFALLAWAWAPAEMYRVVALFTDWRNMAQFGAAFLKPNFHDWDEYLADMVVTVQIAIWGTALAVAFGIPFSILSAANVCPQW